MGRGHDPCNARAPCIVEDAALALLNAAPLRGDHRALALPPCLPTHLLQQLDLMLLLMRLRLLLLGMPWQHRLAAL